MKYADRQVELPMMHSFYTLHANNITKMVLQISIFTCLKVFFTRNGKTVGVRQVRIPKGGFFPTIGMLSVQEKVRVDLRPLTG
jgi:hypothetical protein